jgi:hypothetical protein
MIEIPNCLKTRSRAHYIEVKKAEIVHMKLFQRQLSVKGRTPMAQIQNVMEIFKLLDKSNCRKCNEATCLAFAAAVFRGVRQLDDCPMLKPEITALFGGTGKKPKALEQDAQEAILQLQKQVETVDLAEAANRLDGRYRNGKLTLKILGKDFSVDSKGNFYTDIHVHGWVVLPVLSYILEGKGTPVSGNWVPLRELDGGKDWYRLFGQRCEKPLKKLVDTHTDLFETIMHLFSGHQVGRQFDSDISVVLHPLPKVPILISYWKPDDGLESDLHLFFDESSEENLNIEAIYTLGTGLVVMFEKIAQRHG